MVKRIFYFATTCEDFFFDWGRNVLFFFFCQQGPFVFIKKVSRDFHRQNVVGSALRHTSHSSHFQKKEKWKKKKYIHIPRLHSRASHHVLPHETQLVCGSLKNIPNKVKVLFFSPFFLSFFFFTHKIFKSHCDMRYSYHHPNFLRRNVFVCEFIRDYWIIAVDWLLTTFIDEIAENSLTKFSNYLIIGNQFSDVKRF